MEKPMKRHIVFWQESYVFRSFWVIWRSFGEFKLKSDKSDHLSV